MCVIDSQYIRTHLELNSNHAPFHLPFLINCYANGFNSFIRVQRSAYVFVKIRHQNLYLVWVWAFKCKFWQLYNFSSHWITEYFFSKQFLFGLGSHHSLHLNQPLPDVTLANALNYVQFLWDFTCWHLWKDQRASNGSSYPKLLKQWCPLSSIFLLLSWLNIDGHSQGSHTMYMIHRIMRYKFIKLWWRDRMMWALCQ